MVTLIEDETYIAFECTIFLVVGEVNLVEVDLYLDLGALLERLQEKTARGAVTKRRKISMRRT